MRPIGSGLARSLLFTLMLTAAACRSGSVTTAGAQALVDDRLFFGRNIPAGGQVTDSQWEAFVRDVVTPRFPEGMTIFAGHGQWRDPRGEIVKEQTLVIEILHRRTAASESALAAIAQEYKKEFGQDAVMRVTSGSTLSFY